MTDTLAPAARHPADGPHRLWQNCALALALARHIRWKSSAWIPPWSIAAWTSAPPNPAPPNKRKFRTT